MLLTGCSETSDQVKIENAINGLQAALEQKSKRKFLAYLDDDFTGSHATSKQNIDRLLTVHFLQHKKISITITHQQTVIDPVIVNQATTQASVIVLGMDGLLPQDGNLFAVKAIWRKEPLSEQWLLRRLEWER